MEITINVGELKAILIENLVAHEKDHAQAVKDFKDKVERELAKAHKKLAETDWSKRGSKRKIQYGDSAGSIYVKVTLVPCYASEYERAIRALNYHTEDTIKLNERQYQQFIDNEWEWSEDYNNSKLEYLK